MCITIQVVSFVTQKIPGSAYPATKSTKSQKSRAYCQTFDEYPQTTFSQSN